jgi:hypothetical protein
MIADQAISALGAFVLTVPSLGACLDCLRFSSNRPRRALGTLSPSLPAPATELIRSTRILSLCTTFLGQESAPPRIALPLGSAAGGRFPLFSCASPASCQARLGRSRTMLEPLAFRRRSNLSFHSENHHGSPIKIRNRPIRPRYLS